MMSSKTHTRKGGLFSELILETFRLNGRILSAGDKLVEELGLTSALWQVLGSISLSRGPLHMAQIARNMGLTRQSVRRSANILEKKGFVTFIDNPDHKRAKLLALTPKGEDVFDQVMEIQITWANEVAKDLNAEDLSTAIDVLRTLGDNL